MKYSIVHLEMSSEDQCTFVCSRGLLKKCSVRAKNPKSSCGWDISHLQPLKDVANQRPGMSIYVCTDALRTFIEQILPHIQYPFYLLSGDSDASVPDEALTPELSKSLLENPYLLRWGGQNMTNMRSVKQIQIPIGLDYHSIASSQPPKQWLSASETSHPPGAQDALLKQFRATAPSWRERICKVYTNAHHRLDRFGDRAAMKQQIPADILVLEPAIIPRADVWRNYTKYAFVASPFGEGVDCHRTWEALCCGAIPIICGNFLKDLFIDLPVLRVAAWSDVTEDLLKQTVEEFSERMFNYDKLNLQYWFDRVTEDYITG